MTGTQQRPEGERPDGPKAGKASAGGGSMGSYASVGLQFALTILVFLYAGQWLDRRLGTSPWLLMVCVFLGAGGAFYSMYRKLMADLHRQEAEQRRQRQQDEPGR